MESGIKKTLLNMQQPQTKVHLPPLEIPLHLLFATDGQIHLLP